MRLYCCQCNGEVDAVQVGGDVIYPNRKDLYQKRFFQCQGCGNYIGCHATGEPLGTIPTPEIRKARILVHAVIDPIWKSKSIKRKELYSIGLKRYHTGEINSVEFAEEVMDFVKQINEYEQRD